MAENPVRPTSKEKLQFLAVVCGLLLLPAVMHAFGLPSVEARYSTASEGSGTFSHRFYTQEIAIETSPLDLAVVGSSEDWTALDCAALEGRLAKKLGRPARVACFGSDWRHRNLYYTVVRDLLARRKVSLLLYGVGTEASNGEHPQSRFWWDFFGSREDLAELPWARMAALYAQSVLGAPRLLLATLRGNEAYGLDPRFTEGEASYVRSRGSLRRAEGFRGKPFADLGLEPPRFTPAELIYRSPALTPARDDVTVNSQVPLTEEDVIYDEQIFRMAERAGTRLAFFLPPYYGERTNAQAGLRRYPFERFGGGVPTIVVACVKLFAGLSDEKIESLYYNPSHLNAAGARFYTEAIAPAIEELLDAR